MKWLQFPVWGLYLLPIVRGEDPEPSLHQMCLAGCETALSLSTFAGQPSIEAGYYLELCANQLHVKSMYACGRKYCSHDEITDGIVYLSDLCRIYGSVSLLSLDIISNLTNSDIDGLSTVALGDSAMINATSIPEQHLFDLGYRTQVVWNRERDIHLLYSKAMFMFWGGILLLGLVSNIVSKLLHGFANTRSWPFAKAHALLVLAPTFRYYCDRSAAGMITVPPRWESIIILSFVIVNFVLCAVSYETFADNLYYSEQYVQLLRYIADRTGYLAYANLPILWLFGVRNNILLWITAWPFSTFNRFHRWVARVAAIEAIVHSVAYTVFTFDEGGYGDYAESWTEQYWCTGAIATIAMSLMIGASIMWLRLRFYDFFLITHIGLALIMLVNLFYHTSIYNGQFDGFLWPCVAIWTLDRLIRFGRIAYNLYRARSMIASVDYDVAANLLRIDLSHFFAQHDSSYAGSHCFLYVINQVKFWESHPFTIVRWRARAELAAKNDSDSSVDSTQYRYSMMVRPRQGFTSRLATRAIESSKGPPKVLLEGPYLQSPQVPSDVSDVLFIIGGSGISVAISSIYLLLDRPSPPTIRLVWSTRHEAMWKSILDRELKHAVAEIQVHAFVTGLEATKTEASVGDCASASSALANAKRQNGRPDVRKCITESMQATSGILHVVACGPASMMNDVRVAVINQLKGGNQRLQVTLESFGW